MVFNCVRKFLLVVITCCILFYIIFICKGHFSKILILNDLQTSKPTETVYIFSAIMRNEEAKSKRIIVNMWDGSREMKFKCCILSSDLTVASVFAKTLNTNYEDDLLLARQYSCSVPEFPGSGSVESVALIKTSKTCSLAEIFTKVQLPLYNTGFNAVLSNFVIYSVLDYTRVEPRQLVGWIEYYKLIGVDKIYLVLQIPDPWTLTILSYYQSKGLVDMVMLPFPMPGVKPDGTDRTLGVAADDVTHHQSDEDVGVALFHSQEILRRHQYVAQINYNEFLISRRWRKIYYFLEETFEKQNTNAAAVRMKRVIVGDQSNSVSKSLKRQRKMINDSQYRTIYMPTRMNTVRGDNYTPSSRYSIITLPEDTAFVYQITQCTAMWIYCIKANASETLLLSRFQSFIDRKVAYIGSLLHLP